MGLIVRWRLDFILYSGIVADMNISNLIGLLVDLTFVCNLGTIGLNLNFSVFYGAELSFFCLQLQRGKLWSEIMF